MSAGRSRRLWTMLVVACACLLVPAVALAAFPGNDPDESPRVNTPNDPEFDPCEADDENPSGPPCTSYFSEEYRLFGFSPDTANSTPVTRTTYTQCSQLDAQGRAANLDAGDPECAQIAGVRADTAWKYSTGDPDVAVAILDTGIRWQDRELVDKVKLNGDELPAPQADGAGIEGADCGTFTAGTDDANGDGAFNVRDFACDARVQIAAGDTEADGILDASDLIARFSDDTDADSNGYVDDIAGWDFFDDDNDPYDASSCCSANGHGTGRAREAVAETNNGEGGAGVCPDCQVIPLRIWDTFVTPGDNFAMGVVYASDNGASVVEGAVGGLTNTRFARRAAEYADSKGVALTFVSSDINSANHNYPTNYNEAIYIGGSLPDTAPYETCGGFGLPLVGDIIELPPEFEEPCGELLDSIGGILGISLGLQPPTTSFFRNSNLTQYGGKADVVMMGATGSENTGQASGAAALLASYGREVFGDNDPLSGNEIRQLLTMTAEDVLPQNTGLVGLADKANPGWDPHFGYGRVNLAGAMERIDSDRVPPEAQIDAPDWFAPVNVDRLPASGLEVHGRAAAPHSETGVGDWELEYACGADALDTAFTEVASGTGPVDGLLGTIPKATLENLADTCNGAVANDFGRPVGSLTDALSTEPPLPGVNPYPAPDPERHSVQLRLTVHEAGDAQNFGRYRKTIFPYRDDGNLQGWPRPLGAEAQPSRLVTGSGGEVPPRMYDLDGDNELDLIQGTSSGELFVLDAAGQPLPSFNGGQPVLTRPLAIADAHGVPAPTGGVPRETLRAPAIGDIDGDLEPEIVATAGEHAYAWERDGSEVEGFPVRIDPALSEPCAEGVEKPCFDAADRVINGDNHIKRGFFGSPALANLDGGGDLEIVAGSLDQHVYAWDGEGEPLPGFPAKVASEDASGAEIVTSPAIAQLDGEGPPEIVIASNEVIGAEPAPPDDPLNQALTLSLLNWLLGSATGSNPVYALNADGTPFSDAWPVEVGVAAGDLLPMVLPGHDAAAFDQDGDGDDEVVVTAGTSVAGGGGVRVVDGDGTTTTTFNNLVSAGEDPTPVLNLADYPILGSLSGEDAPSVVKGGITLNGAANLLAPNQNLPFAHVVQAWPAGDGSVTTSPSVPGYPRPTDDFQLVSQPAIAKVDGSGAGRQVLFGTGLYQLHAYGPGGTEPADWPKFLGGWVQATPTVGDADGDGKLDVSAVTREGWSFLWATDADACDADGTSTNEEWWTFHHDEHGTANRGHDARPPGTVTGLAAAEGVAGATELAWTAPGDDWLCGEADRVRIVVDDAPIDSPAGTTTVLEREAGGPVGADETATLSAAERGGATHAGVLYRDEAGNWGLVRSVELPRGPDQPEPPPPPGAACTDRISGTADADKLSGGPGSERITGRGGKDRLNGRGGDDCVSGQGGADRIAGGDGDDELRGGRGADRLRGGAGNDVIRVHRGARDRVSCGPGKDRVILNRKRDRAKRDCEKLTFARG